ncbi:MAG: NAD(P)/FAD-dependent oxidoreductase [Saprospiraceae bacterium]
MKKNSIQYDILIIGGGPAGTSAGMTALKRKGTKVAVIESSNYSNYRIGESLTPGVRPLLEYLNVWENFRNEQSLDAFGSRSVWGSDQVETLDYMFTIHGQGWSLDRLRFDKMLAENFKKQGGELFISTKFLRSSFSDGIWIVECQDENGNIFQIKAKYLIDATGRKGLIARQQGATRKVFDKLIGVACIGTFDSDTNIEHFLSVEACSYGWWYVSPLPNNKVAVVLMSDSDVISQLKAVQSQQFFQLLFSTKHTQERVKNISFGDVPTAFSAFSSYLTKMGSDNWIAIGDAVASHDPLSSTGIPHAISSGIHGARVADDFLFGDGILLPYYEKGIQENYMQYLKTRSKYYVKERRWHDEIFWKRRTTPVMLNPHTHIIKNDNKEILNFTQTTYLTKTYSQKLLKYCETKIEMHQVVNRFAKEYPQFPDENIILGLQELVISKHINVCR